MAVLGNPNPHFTSWVVSERILSERITIVDIGCSSSDDQRWVNLGDHLDYHGISPCEELIHNLRKQNTTKQSKVFHHVGIGYRDLPARTRDNKSDVPVRRLDTFHDEGNIPLADILVLDCDGFEPEVLSVGTEYIKAVKLVAIESCTGFEITASRPHTHFYELSKILLPVQFALFQLMFKRQPSPLFSAQTAEPDVVSGALSASPKVMPPEATVRFCRNFTHPAFAVASEDRPAAQAIIRAVIVFELNGRPDWALWHIIRFARYLQDQIDVRYAKHLLLRDVADSITEITYSNVGRMVSADNAEAFSDG